MHEPELQLFSEFWPGHPTGQIGAPKEHLPKKLHYSYSFKECIYTSIPTYFVFHCSRDDLLRSGFHTSTRPVTTSTTDLVPGASAELDNTWNLPGYEYTPFPYASLL